MSSNGSAPLNLDQNATTPLDSEVAEAMLQCYRDYSGNPASQHTLGRKARRIVEDARAGIADLLGADISGPRGDRLVITSGGTESNNLAVFGLAGSAPGKLLISPLEHPSIAGPVEQLSRRGYQRLRMSVTREGTVDLEAAAGLLAQRPRLACLILGNHETGVLQPVHELVRLAAIHETVVHTDAVQAVGKIPVNFAQLGVASLAFTAHKLHGPVGIGGLLVRRDIPLQPLMYGGFQQSGLRPGTEAVALTVGFHRALQIWFRNGESRRRQLRSLRERLERQLQTGDSTAVIHGEQSERLPHTINISFPGVDRQALVMALDLAGVAVSTGSACQSGSSDPSPALLAMGVSADFVSSSIRISLGSTLNNSDIAEGATRILSTVHDLRRRSNSRKSAQLPRH